MRWNFFAQAARLGRHRGLHLLAHGRQFLLQLVDLALLAINSLVQLFEEIFGKTEFCFNVFETVFH